MIEPLSGKLCEIRAYRFLNFMVDLFLNVCILVNVI